MNALLIAKTNYPELFMRASAIDSSPVSIGTVVRFTNARGEVLCIGEDVQCFGSHNLPIDPMEFFLAEIALKSPKVKRQMVRPARGFSQKLDAWLKAQGLDC